MALSEKSRAEMFNYFSSTPLGEEVTSEMIANFPESNFDDLVTKDFLRAEFAEFRTEMHTLVNGRTSELRSDINGESSSLRSEIANLRSDLRSEMAGLRSDTADLRTDMTGLINNRTSDLRSDTTDLRNDMNDKIQTSFLWTITTMIALFGILAGLILAGY